MSDAVLCARNLFYIRIFCFTFYKSLPVNLSTKTFTENPVTSVIPHLLHVFFRLSEGSMFPLADGSIHQPGRRTAETM